MEYPEHGKRHNQGHGARDRYTPVRVTTTMEELLRHATEQNFVPVVDDRDIFMGIVTRRALLTYCLKNGMETESLPTAEYVRRES